MTTLLKEVKKEQRVDEICRYLEFASEGGGGGYSGVVQYVFTGFESRPEVRRTFVFQTGKGHMVHEPELSPDCSVFVDADTFLKIYSGELGISAFTNLVWQGKIQVGGTWAARMAGIRAAGSIDYNRWDAFYEHEEKEVGAYASRAEEQTRNLLSKIAGIYRERLTSLRVHSFDNLTEGQDTMPQQMDVAAKASPSQFPFAHLWRRLPRRYLGDRMKEYVQSGSGLAERVFGVYNMF